MGYFFGFCILVLAACTYMMYRNNCVFSYRTTMLFSDHAKYETLPSYDTMMGKFWVWPLSKFEPQKPNIRLVK